MTMPYFSMTGPRPLHGVLKWEGAPEVTRRGVTILAGSGSARLIRQGSLAGLRLFGSVTIANGTNTGGGSVGSVTRGRACKIGVYTLRCIATASNAGTFALTDPEGYRLPDATVGVAYSNPQIGFTLADTGTDFAVGDSFTLTVAKGDEKATEIDFTATDGRQIAAGLFIADYQAPDGSDGSGVIVRADARLNLTEIVWPAGVTTDNKIAALADMAARRISTAEEG